MCSLTVSDGGEICAYLLPWTKGAGGGAGDNVEELPGVV